MHASLRRGVAGASGLLLAIGTLAIAPSAQAEPEGAPVEDATFTWGLSGYAQKGVATFGPWKFKDLSGNAAQLVGSVSGGNQSAYLVKPVPATSMPAGGDSPNAVRFTAGTGEVDAAGTSTITWDGTYTVNAYPPQYGAPDEIYSDPELTVEPDGSGTVTMDVTIGAGEGQSGEPIPETPLGRITVMTFDAGSVDDPTANQYRVMPDYQGVEVDLEGGPQERTCSTDGGATGWWGSWPTTYVQALSAAIQPHFYSTGCGGMQDNKPPLPFDISLGDQASATPSVNVSDTALPARGKHQITITGKGFDPSLAMGTRPPLAGRSSGTYIIFGKFAKKWRPSKGASSGARPAAAQKWAVLAEDMVPIGGTADGAVELKPDGSFTTKLTVSKKAADDAANGNGRYGIYTYAGSGAVEASYETMTRIRFQKSPSTLKANLAKKRAYGKNVRANVRVRTSGTAATGVVKARAHGRTLTKARLRKGRATLRLPSRLAVGKHRVRFVYAGNATVRKAAVRRPLRIVKAGARVNARLRTKQVTPRKRAVVKVKVRSRVRGVRVRGAVRVLDGKRVLNKRVRIGTMGNARVRLPRLRVGKHTIRVRYLGSATHKRDTDRVRVRVRRR